LKTVEKETVIEFEEKKSKFIGYIKPVSTVEEAEKFIDSIKEMHPNATHNVPLYRVVENGQEYFKYNDDGEPANTAGKPMAEILNILDVYNVAIVATRYFGGIKLGAGGLIRAYAGSVALAIKEIGLVEIKGQTGLRLKLSYSQYQDFANFLKAENLAEYDTEFTDTVSTLLFVDKGERELLKDKLTEFFKGKLEMIDQGLRQVEVPLMF